MKYFIFYSFVFIDQTVKDLVGYIALLFGTEISNLYSLVNFSYIGKFICIVLKEFFSYFLSKKAFCGFHSI
jgi:hypothetical protein